MNIWRSVSGMVEVHILSAEPSSLLEELRNNDISVYHIHEMNDLTIIAKILRKDLRLIKRIVARRNDKIQVKKYFGLYWHLCSTLFRPVVLGALMIVFLSACILPGRVYFVKIQGNRDIPSNLIAETAEKCGISFGAKRAYVRSEKVKNQLLERIPELRWVGINTQGCVAIISVSEEYLPDVRDNDMALRSIVAACDGVIEECTITKGNSLCKVGDAVKAGQILVSGYTDCGILIQVSNADAEIFAQTKREVDMVALSSPMVRAQKTEERRKISLLIGKKQINFYKHSGISDALCVKMKKTKYLVLPGGFRLPVALVIEREIHHEISEVSMGKSDWLSSYADAYLRYQMVSGRILTASSRLEESDGLFQYHCVYDCYEMIGIPKYEEIVK